MNAFHKFLSDWRARNMNLVNPQGSYIVWGYWLPEGQDGFREHVSTFRDLSRCIEIANGYATKTRFAQIVASSGTLVYDTRKSVGGVARVGIMFLLSLCPLSSAIIRAGLPIAKTV